MINYCGIELYKTACDRDIPNVAMTLEDGGWGINFSIPPAREAIKRGWVCALLPPVIGGTPPNKSEQLILQCCSF